jgi:hypothetical protein
LKTKHPNVGVGSDKPFAEKEKFMAEQTPLMPKATAVWLIDNTSLSFEQIADFCGLHPLEVKGIADEDVAKGIKGIDPIAAGQLSREQIEAAEKDPSKRLKLLAAKYKLPHVKQKKAPRYTPVSKRQDKPDAIYWLLRNHPELTDADIMKLIGTTKATIAKIRDRGHWNAANIKAVDPVTLGLCTQIELDFVVARAANRKPRAAKKTGEGLKPVAETTAGLDKQAASTREEEAEKPKVPYSDYASESKPKTPEPKAPEATADSVFGSKPAEGAEPAAEEPASADPYQDALTGEEWREPD